MSLCSTLCWTFSGVYQNTLDTLSALSLEGPLSSRRILIICEGSRGDCQPNIVMGLALQDAGATVTVFTNADHEGLCQNFGLNFISNEANFSDCFNKDKMVVEAISNNSIMDFLKLIDTYNTKWWKIGFPILKKTFEENSFDLVIVGTNRWYEATWLPFVFNVPCIMFWVCSPTWNKSKAPYGLPKLPCGMNNIWWSAVTGAYFKDQKKAKDPDIIELPDMTKDLLPTLSDYVDWGNSPTYPFPVLVALDEDYDVLPPKRPPHIVYTGSFILSADKQTGDEFGGNQEQELEMFLAAGDPPVYIGWGSVSCHSKKFQTCLALRTLMKIQRRGIILKGWAGLAISDVKGENDEAELCDYAKDHVLFMDSAAHDVLFPRCAAIVHHGGTGTTAASIRSGKPVVVTPIFFDQFVNADKVTQAGIGLKTKQLAKMSPNALAKAIDQVLSNQGILKKAMEVTENLKKAPDSAEIVVQTVAKFFNESIDTGDWKKEIQRQRRRRLARKNRTLLQKLTWCCCCGVAAAKDLNPNGAV